MVFLVSVLNLTVKIFATITEEQENLSNMIQTYFKNFPAYLTLENNNNIPNIICTITFYSSIEQLKNNESIDLINEHKTNNSKDLLLIGVFTHLLDDFFEYNEITSLIQENLFVFVNYESKDILLSEKNVIPFIMLNEFMNYLFFSNEKKLEIHNGPCSRNINTLQDINPSKVVNSLSFLQDEVKFCSMCSEKILKAIQKLEINNLVSATNTSSTLKEESNSKPVIPEVDQGSENLVQRATSPPPRRIKELVDPNANLSFAQRKQISAILKELSILKEPLDDSEYLEVRKRFFEGKISEQVFLQILKRKSK